MRFRIMFSDELCELNKNSHKDYEEYLTEKKLRSIVKGNIVLNALDMGNSKLYGDQRNCLDVSLTGRQCHMGDCGSCDYLLEVFYDSNCGPVEDDKLYCGCCALLLNRKLYEK